MSTDLHRSPAPTSPRWLRKSIALAVGLVAIAISAVLVPLPDGASAQGPTADECVDGTVTRYLGRLGLEKDEFWDGAYVDTDADPDKGICTYEYLIDVADGDRLRFAMDAILAYRDDGTVHDEAGEGMTGGIQLVGPDGHAVRFGTNSLGGDAVALQPYSTELFVCFNRQPGQLCAPYRGDAGHPDWQAGATFPCDGDPETLAPRYECENDRAAAVPNGSSGRWIVRVAPETSSGWRFRMRAKLEATPSPVPVGATQLPNLRSMPPYDLTFCEPTASATQLVGTGRECGPDTDGLTPEEHTQLTAEQGPAPKLGLRFSVGQQNWGPGFLHLRLCEGSTPTPGPEGQTAPACQRLYRANGTQAEPDRPAGTFEYSDSHGHWHYPFFQYELYSVDRDTLANNKTGAPQDGRKEGFCPSNLGIADWEHFIQLPFIATIPTCASPSEPQMTLTAGWGDAYEWQRPQQFVQFPIDPLTGEPKEGFYLLRTTVNVTGLIAERTTGDNTSYAYFEVCSRAECNPQGSNGIRLIDRDYGPKPYGTGSS